jgi:hypothetical protein
MTTPSIAEQQVTQLLGVIAADSFPARARSLAYKAFTVVFYGSKIFDRKTAQLSETLRESGYLVSTSKNRLRNMAKTGAKSLS